MTRWLLSAALAAGLCAPLALPGASAQPRVRVDGAIRTLDFSADGKRMAVGYDAASRGQVAVYSMRYRSRDPIELPRMEAPIAFAGFAAGGELIAAADTKGTLVVWKVDDGSELFRIDLAKRAGGEGSRVKAMANPVAPYVGWLAVAGGKADGKLEVARVPGGQVVTSVSKIQLPRVARWSLHGGHLLIDGTAWNWDTLKRWKPKVAGVTATASDGARLVYTSPKGCDGFLTIAEIETGKVLRSIPIGREACPRWVWFSARDRGLVWIGPAAKDADGHAVYGWDERRGRQKRIRKLDVEPTVAALNADRDLLAISDGRDVTYIRLR
jgi:hypothetical protein